MKELIIKYSRFSEKKQKFSEKMQLICAAIALMAVGLEGLESDSKIQFYISLIFILVSILDFVLAIKYEKFISMYKVNFEIIILRINGIVMLLTGLSLQYLGKDLIQYPYYILSVFYIYVIPKMSLKAKSKRLIILSESGIQIKRILFSALEYNWSKLENYEFYNMVFRIWILGEKKPKKYFISEKNTRNIKDIEDFLNKYLCKRWLDKN